IGASGQIKEFREETYYGEIGDPAHRHISHLLGLAPCSVISRKTPAWLAAAAVSLRKRGNVAGGWGLANRMYAWARIGDAAEFARTFDKLLSECVFENLWSNHDAGNEFQIDANVGACAAIGEALLQSHEEGVRLLPCLHGAWQSGSFSGVCARGGFEIGASWKDSALTEACVLSKASEPFVLYTPDDVTVTDQDGNRISLSKTDDTISFATKKGELYRITGFTANNL
ncbi:MAG: glycoside hydrolase family 95 protein, partial [Clostridia bacterium]|nr:glycoside hydrolase family 95 protein [Clostridia bacterium]